MPITLKIMLMMFQFIVQTKSRGPRLRFVKCKSCSKTDVGWGSELFFYGWLEIRLLENYTMGFNSKERQGNSIMSALGCHHSSQCVNGSQMNSAWP